MCTVNVHIAIDSGRYYYAFTKNQFMKHITTLVWALALGFAVNAQTTAVTFQVDMSDETVSSDGVHVAGSFQGWDPAGTALADDDMDGVYAVTVNISDSVLSASLGSIEFKYINGNAWGADESAPDACAAPGSTNRTAQITEQQDIVLDVVCFGSCSACGVVTATFLVDMSQEEAINPVGVHMNGSFNDWASDNFLEMSDPDGDLVYSYTATLEGAQAGDTLEFKFLNGNTWGFDESFSGDCASQFGNRYIILDGTADQLYVISETGQAYCYASCTSCVAPTSVTLRVDMSTQAAISANGVSVAGSFQGWTPGADVLSDDDADLIYEIQLEIAPGDYEFKFVNGNDWGGNGDGNIDNENPPGECTSNGNRVLTVGADPVVLQYCYNQCTESCVADPDAAPITFRIDMSNETVSAEGVWLIGGITTPAWQAGAVQLSDDDGDSMYETTVEVSGSAFFQYKYANGDPFPGGEVDDSVSETGDFDAGGCGEPNPFGAFNRTHIRSGAAETLGNYCFNSCLTCSGDTVTTDSTDFVLELHAGIALQAFPNPASGQINLQTDGDLTGLTAIRIYDMRGRLVFTDHRQMFAGQAVTLATQLIPSGLYLLEVQSGVDRSVLRVTFH